MSNLTLCQQVHRLLGPGDGLPGTLPTTVVAQTGVAGEIVNWVTRAWLDVQNLRADWRWMTVQDTFPTVAGTRVYALTTVDAAAEDIRPFSYENGLQYITCYSSQADESPVYYVPYEQFRGCLDLGTRTSARPQYYTCLPNRDVELDPTPDAVYTVRFDRKALPQTFTADANEPADYPVAGKGLLAQYQDIIVWRAVQYYCITRGDRGPLYQMAEREYSRILNAMQRRYLPQVNLLGPSWF